MKDKALADIGGDSACPVPPLRKRAMMTYYLYMSFHIWGAEVAGVKSLLGFRLLLSVSHENQGIRI
jgi:hypothetical protein